jgi:hypothetical protein
MLFWIIVAVAIYLIIGIGILIYGTINDPYGGYLLEFWWVVILLYPYFIIRWLCGK